MSTRSTTPTSRRGALTAASAFLIWGVVPIYWRQMHEVSPFELIAHRSTWSLLFLLGVLALRKELGALRAAFTDARVFLLTALASLLLAANWTIYVWAVNSGHIVESSLGYFLTPLCNVALGFLFLRERLRPLQWTAVGAAALGVAVLLARVGRVPWIALSLAGTWATYGILKKRSPLGPLAGLTVETIVLAPFSAALLLWLGHTGEGALGHVGPLLHVYILSVGVVTAVPLLLFASGARRIRMTTLGLLQYISPTAQLMVGLFVYGEAFDADRLGAFALIWAGLALYSTDAILAQRPGLTKHAA